MAGRARHLPRHLHHRLALAIAHQPSWFTADAVLTGLGPTMQRFRRREVVSFLMQLVRLQLLQVEGTGPRHYRRRFDEGWLEHCRRELAGDLALRLEIPS
jgi:hypothetical protein